MGLRGGDALHGRAVDEFRALVGTLLEGCTTAEHTALQQAGHRRDALLGTPRLSAATTTTTASKLSAVLGKLPSVVGEGGAAHVRRTRGAGSSASASSTCYAASSSSSSVSSSADDVVSSCSSSSVSAAACGAPAAAPAAAQDPSCSSPMQTPPRVPSVAEQRLAVYRLKKASATRCAGAATPDTPAAAARSGAATEEAETQTEDEAADEAAAGGRAEAAEARCATLEDEKRALASRLRVCEAAAAKHQRKEASLAGEVARLQAELTAARALAEAPPPPPASEAGAAALKRAEDEIDNLVAQNVSLIEQLECYVAQDEGRGCGGAALLTDEDDGDDALDASDLL